MGVRIKELLVRTPATLESFSSRVVAIDAYNAMYQFLANIRGPDGAQLADAEGNVTSHLSGLFYRTTSFLSTGIRPVYVFDGRPPSLKSAEIERRRRAKQDAAVRYEMAVSEGRAEDARKYAQQTTSMLDGMVAEAKELLGLLGVPCVDAPSEGEATAAHMTRTGAAHASASQDFDSVLFGAARMVRNFTNSGRRKLPNRNAYVDVVPEVVELEGSLAAIGLTREQLVDVGILVGTDFNPDGFARIGPKTALKLVREHGRLEDIPRIQEDLGGTDYEAIRAIFLEPEVAEDPAVEFCGVQRGAVVEYLSGSRGFSEGRVAAALDRLDRARERRGQSLDRWL